MTRNGLQNHCALLVMTIGPPGIAEGIRISKNSEKRRKHVIQHAQTQTHHSECVVTIPLNHRAARFCMQSNTRIHPPPIFIIQHEREPILSSNTKKSHFIIQHVREQPLLSNTRKPHFIIQHERKPLGDGIAGSPRVCTVLRCGKKRQSEECSRGSVNKALKKEENEIRTDNGLR